MSIPDFQTLMRPVLAYLADGQQKSTKAVIDVMSDEFGLTDYERSQMIPSGRAKLMDNRVHWSLTHMSQAGLLDRPVRAQVKISPEGLKVLQAYPDRVDMTVLRNYPAYREFRERSRAKQPSVSISEKDHTVDRPRIHEFAGALLGKQGDRGVFITTSRFSTGAKSEAETAPGWPGFWSSTA
jgi:restriction endonuclease Mrr